ncbi:MAG: universal stress protein [Bacteroidota bacterium]|nr:universal stress protein [Bacteroidota bacterium]
MHNYKNICLDINGLGETIKPSILGLITLLKVQKIFFYHFELKNEEENDNAILIEGEKTNCKEKLKALIKNNSIKGISIHPEVMELNDDFVRSLLKALMKFDIDILCFEFDNGSAKREEIIKIAKNAYCTVITLPVGGPVVPIKRILLPIDFSEYSRKAVEFVFELSNTSNISIIVNHVYCVPAGYHATGKSYEESASIIKQGAKKDCQKFLKEYEIQNSPITYSCILDDDKDPTDKIYKDAVDNEIDLIIIGSKGKTNSVEILTGSTAFGLLMYNQKVSMLIMKHKMANYDLAEEVLK